MIASDVAHSLLLSSCNQRSKALSGTGLTGEDIAVSLLLAIGFPLRTLGGNADNPRSNDSKSFDYRFWILEIQSTVHSPICLFTGNKFKIDWMLQFVDLVAVIGFLFRPFPSGSFLRHQLRTRYMLFKVKCVVYERHSGDPLVYKVRIIICNPCKPSNSYTVSFTFTKINLTLYVAC